MPDGLAGISKDLAPTVSLPGLWNQVFGMTNNSATKEIFEPAEEHNTEASDTDEDYLHQLQMQLDIIHDECPDAFLWADEAQKIFSKFDYNVVTGLCANEEKRGELCSEFDAFEKRLSKHIESLDLELGEAVAEILDIHKSTKKIEHRLKVWHDYEVRLRQWNPVNPRLFKNLKHEQHIKIAIDKLRANGMDFEAIARQVCLKGIEIDWKDVEAGRHHEGPRRCYLGGRDGYCRDENDRIIHTILDYVKSLYYRYDPDDFFDEDQKISIDKKINKDGKIVKEPQEITSYKFVPTRLGMAIAKHEPLLTLLKADTLFVYHKGKYIPTGENIIHDIANKIVGETESIKEHDFSEVLFRAKVNSLANDDIFEELSPELLSVGNGILNLMTGKLDFPNPEKYKCLASLPTFYDPRADCPNIDRFLHEIVATEEDVQRLYELIGYCLWRRYPIQKLFILTGEGSNGKSIFLALLTIFLGGDNVSSQTFEQLTSDKEHQRIPLYGKLANIAGDISHKEISDFSIFKLVTGGDLITDRWLYGQPLSFPNHAKCISSCNGLPPIREDTVAVWRRIELIDFPFEFLMQLSENPKPHQRQAKDWDELLATLTTPTELSGLLNRAIKALRTLLEHQQFTNSMTVEQIRTTYIRRSAPLKVFLDEKCIAGVDWEVVREEFIETYNAWCTEAGLPHEKPETIGRKLKRIYGIESGREMIQGDRKYIWYGITLKCDKRQRGSMDQKTLDTPA